MSGHSKWANTKHRKSIQDVKRGKIFTKIIRDLVTGTRLGGSDPDSNPRLRAAIDKALSNNMASCTVSRAIARGIRNGDNSNMEIIIYEGYGPGGIAMIIECLSDNRNRTVGALRHAFRKYGSKLGTDGSVSYLFTKKGVITYANGVDEDTLIEAALAAGIEDIVSYHDGSINLFTPRESLDFLKDALSSAGFNAQMAKIVMVPSTTVNIDKEATLKLLRLINILQDYDDVQAVYHNAKISNEISITIQ